MYVFILHYVMPDVWSIVARNYQQSSLDLTFLPHYRPLPIRIWVRLGICLLTCKMTQNSAQGG